MAENAVMCQDIAHGLAHVQERMHKAMQEAQRTDEVTLVAISKLQSAEAIRAAADSGQMHFGENYVQEALAKQDELHDLSVQWHFTGHIQSRKAKDVVGRFGLIHTVDSEKLALLIEQHATKIDIIQPVLIQVNVGSEAQKSGVAIKDLPNLAEKISMRTHLDLQGLMCLPPVFDAGLAARPHFELLRTLRDDLASKLGCALPHLSMGMSGDMEAAIFEGATIVRVGTDIFGSRIT